MTSFELANRLKDRQRRRNISQRQIVVKGLEVKAPVNPVPEQRFGLRCKDQAVREVRIVERLDAEPVAREEESMPTRIPERQGKHPVEPVNEALSLFFVEMNHDLGIGSRHELMPFRAEPLTKLVEVVDLPIKNNPDRSVLVRDRLAPRIEVDDGESSHSQPHRAVAVVSFVVRATMDKLTTHRPQVLQAHRARPIEVELSSDPAHS